MKHISYSRQSTYLRCPYSHYLSYVLNLTPKKPSRPLTFGSDFHKLLEFRGDKKQCSIIIKAIREKYYEIPAAWQADLGENYVEDLKTIFMDYMKIYKDAPLPTVTEKRFELPLGNIDGEEILFIGVIDGLYEDEDGVRIEEHKTFNNRPNLATLVMNTQKCLYAKAVQSIYGSLPREVIWDYIKSTPAEEPIWLEKSQKFSTAKSDKITPYSYIRAAKRRGLEKAEILQNAKAYEGNIYNYFFRVPMSFTEQMVERVWDGFKYTAQEIIRNGEKNKTMNLTRDCSWCDFFPICQAELTGGDVNYTIEKDFKQKEER